ncbi:TRAP transporter substrate-binding protein [Tissierellaceae bacterium HCP3S3_D8]
MIKRNIAVLLILVVVISALTGCRPSTSSSGGKAGNSDSTTIRVGHVLAPTHPYTLGLEKFAELVAEKTDNKVKVEVFHSSQLGNERDMIEGLQLGTLEMALVSTAPLSSFTNDFLVFDLPFIFKDTENARKVLDSEIGQKLLDDLQDQEIIGLAYWENGFRSVTNNKKPIEHPSDLSGLKIRTMENPVHMESFNIMGASATPMAFGELFTALQQNTVDGQENPLPIVESSKYYEVQKYLSLTEHFYAPAPLLISEEYFNGLSPEIQDAIKEAAIEGREYERGLIDEMNAKLLKELEEKGMQINAPDKSVFVEAVQPVYDKFSNQIPADLIQSVRDAQN